MSASWTGKDTGEVTLPASATWCAASRLLEVTAIRQDSGIGLAVYPQDSLVAGAYAAFKPAGDSVTRPGVAGAVRWFTVTEIKGYQSDSGALELEKGSGAVSGRLGMRMHGFGLNDTIRLRGELHRVPIRPAGSDCAADSLRR